MRGSVEVITEGGEGSTMQDLGGISRQLVHKPTNQHHYTTNFVSNRSVNFTFFSYSSSAPQYESLLITLYFTTTSHTDDSAVQFGCST